MPSAVIYHLLHLLSSTEEFNNELPVYNSIKRLSSYYRWCQWLKPKIQISLPQPPNLLIIYFILILHLTMFGKVLSLLFQTHPSVASSPPFSSTDVRLHGISLKPLSNQQPQCPYSLVFPLSSIIKGWSSNLTMFVLIWLLYNSLILFPSSPINSNTPTVTM